MADRGRPTRVQRDADEGFLRRWSRRKAEARSPETPLAEAASDGAEPARASPEQMPEPAASTPASIDPKDLPAIESLDASSDFTVFMRPGVPENLRTLALRKLWRFDPIFSKLDGLVEYGEDYPLPSWSKGTIKTAYQIGRGFVNELEKLAEPKAEPALPTPPEGPTSEVAPAIGPTTPEEPVALAEPRQPAPEAPRSDDGRGAAQSTPGPARPKAGTRRLPRRG